MSVSTVRRRARERAVQFLFGLDFTHYEWESAIEGFWQNNASAPGVRTYAENLIRKTIDHRVEIDSAIASALNTWQFDRVGRVELNVIRVALCEMRYTQVPPAVAINEAIEVAKRFGDADATRFVNGVLDRLKEDVPRPNDS